MRYHPNKILPTDAVEDAVAAFVQRRDFGIIQQRRPLFSRRGDQIDEQPRIVKLAVIINHASGKTIGVDAQAREFYGPQREQNDAPVRIAERDGCMKECISGGAFADVVISTFFGFAPSVDGKHILADPQTPRPFTGKLLHVSFRGERLTITANEKGASVFKE